MIDLTKYFPIATGIIRGKRRTWTVAISQRIEPAPVPEPEPIKINLARQLSLQYSDPTGGSMGRGVMPSYTSLRVFDVGKRLYNALVAIKDAAPLPDDVICTLSTGVHQWIGLIDLSTLREPVSNRRAVPVLTLEVADGLNDVKRVVEANNLAITNGTIHAFFRNFLAHSLAPLPIAYKFNWKPTNLEDGVASVVSRVGVSNNGGLLSIGLWDTITEEMLNALSQQFGFRVWQSLLGRWHVEQFTLIGRQIGLGAGAEFWAFDPAQFPDDVDAPAQVEVAKSQVAVTGDDLKSFGLDEDSGWPIGTVKFSVGRNITTPEDVLLSFGTVDTLALNPDPFFRYWRNDLSPMFWEVEYGALQRSQLSTDAGYKDAGLVSTDGIVSIATAILPPEKHFRVQCLVGLVNAAGNEDVTPQGVEFQVEYVTTGGVVYYLEPLNGWWTETPTTLEQPNVVPVLATASSGNFTLLDIRSTMKLYVPGYIRVRIIGQNTRHVLLSDFYIMPVDEAGEHSTSFEGEWEYSPIYVPGKTEELEIARPFWEANVTGTITPFMGTPYPGQGHGFIIVYRDDGGNRTDAPGGGFVPAEAWEGEDEEGAYLIRDLGFLAATRAYLPPVLRGIKTYTGKVPGLLDPGTLLVVKGVPAVALNLTLDLVNETTEGTWQENPRSVADIGAAIGPEALKYDLNT